MDTSQTTGFPLPSRKIGGLRRHVLRSQGGPAYVNSSLPGPTQTYKGTQRDFFHFLLAADDYAYLLAIVGAAASRRQRARTSLRIIMPIISAVCAGGNRISEERPSIRLDLSTAAR